MLSVPKVFPWMADYTVLSRPSHISEGSTSYEGFSSLNGPAPP